MTSIGQTGNTSLPVTAEDLGALLEAQILADEFKAGQKLPSERVLAEQFGVGRPLVREVLRSLQERGLIEAHAGRGTFVREVRMTESGVSVDVIARRGMITPRELIVARTMLETEAAELAARMHSDDDLDRMLVHLSTLEELSSPASAVRADLAFHEAIALASGNRVIQIMFGSIRNLVEGIMIRSLSDPQVRAEAVPSHRLIFEAIRDGEADLAREHMLGHLAVAAHLYGDDLDKSLRDVLAARGHDFFDHRNW